MALKDSPPLAGIFRVIKTQFYPDIPTAPDIWKGLGAIISIERGILGGKRVLLAHIQTSQGFQQLGQVSPEDLSQIEEGQRFNAFLYSYRYNPPDGKTSSVYVFPHVAPPEVIRRCLWIRKMMVPYAEQGAWGPLPGLKWVWKGQVISAQHNGWRWNGHIFNVRMRADGGLEAESSLAKKLVGFHYLGKPANYSERAMWRGQERQLKAFSVRVNSYRHEIALFSADMPDNECRAALGI